MRAARLGFLLLLAAACQQAEPPAPPDTAARIGTEDVRYSDFESYLARSVGDAESVLASDVLSQLFDQFLEERLLAHLAVDRQLVREARGPGGLRRAIEALLADGLRQEPDAGEIARYYQAHQQEFARPERVRLRQILTEDRAAAEKALREIAEGAAFGEVARRLSREPSAASGGDQGELSREDLPPAFADVIFSLQPGEVSPLVPADYGFHIFQVTARQPAEVVSLEQARGEILARLRQERADRLLGALVQQARSRYNVKVYERNLPFDYEGLYSESQTQKSH